MLRIRIALAVLLAVLVTTAGVASPAAAHHVRPGYDAWTSAALNLRAGPSTSARVLRVLPAGSRVRVRSAVASHWYAVSSAGTDGYVAGSYLAGAPSYVFPVQPASAASYGTCHHDYPATDIFVAVGRQYVSPTAGTVTWLSRTDTWDPEVDDPATRSGIAVSVLGDDGVRYYGSHLSSLAAGVTPGARVRAGQLLGLTGKSGNARYTPAHVHFGISAPTRPDDVLVRRGTVAPHPYLAAWRAGRLATPDLTRTGTGVC